MARIDPYPELKPSQRLLRAVFGYEYQSFPPRPKVDDHAVDEVTAWQFIDEVLSERQALALKYRFGQVGRCHTLKEIASILPRADGRSVGVPRKSVGKIEKEALEKLRHVKSPTLLHLGTGSPVEPPAPVVSVVDSTRTSPNGTVEPDVLDMPPTETSPEPNPSQRLLRAVFGYSWDAVPDHKPCVDDHAVNEAAMWQFIDVELPEIEAFVLKCRVGQFGRCHALDEIAHVLPRADGAGIGVTRERIRQIEARAMRRLRIPPRCRTLLRLAKGSPTKPLDASSQRLLREVFSHDQCRRGFPFWPWADDHAVDGFAVWKFIERVLLEEEAFVLKYRFGQVGRSHTVEEIACILPYAHGGGIGATSVVVRNIEESALAELRWEPIAQSLWDLAMGRPTDPSVENLVRSRNRMGEGQQQSEMPLEELELSRPVFSCLRRNRITKVGDVLDKSERDRLAMRKFGRKSLEELKERLLENGLSLRQDDEQS